MELKRKVLHSSSGSHGIDIAAATNMLWDLPHTFWPRQWPCYHWSFTCFKLAKNTKQNKNYNTSLFHHKTLFWTCLKNIAQRSQMESTQDYYCSYFFFPKENSFQVHPINTQGMEKEMTKKINALPWFGFCSSKKKTKCAYFQF